MRLGFRAVAALALVATVAGCGSSGSSSSGKSRSKSAAKISGTVTVFAAASLTETFQALGKTFEAEHPGTKVVFSFGGSDTLAASITGGAPADVFAAASTKTMKTVTDADDVSGTPTTFAKNQLEIATLPGNPKNIHSLQDLTNPKFKVALCAKEVPCGAAAQTALDDAGVKVTPVSYEQDVKSALTKVELKEVDASIVYKSDVKSANGKVEGVHFPESAKAINTYPIALLRHAPNPAAAKQFIALVTSSQGEKALTDNGFLAP